MMKFTLASILFFLVGCSSAKKQTSAEALNNESADKKIDREAIRQVIRKDFLGFRHCYEAGLEKDDTLAGKILLEWDIDSIGKVVNAKVDQEKSDLKNADVQKCMTDEVSKLTFPGAPSGKLSVIFPFYFKNE